MKPYLYQDSVNLFLVNINDSVGRSMHIGHTAKQCWAGCWNLRGVPVITGRISDILIIELTSNNMVLFIVPAIIALSV